MSPGKECRCCFKIILLSSRSSLSLCSLTTDRHCLDRLASAKSWKTPWPASCSTILVAARSGSMSNAMALNLPPARDLTTGYLYDRPVVTDEDDRLRGRVIFIKIVRNSFPRNLRHRFSGLEPIFCGTCAPQDNSKDQLRAELSGPSSVGVVLKHLRRQAPRPCVYPTHTHDDSASVYSVVRMEARDFLKAACSQPSGDAEVSRPSTAGRYDSFIKNQLQQPSVDPSLAFLSKNWVPVGTRPVPSAETSERTERSILQRIFSQQPVVNEGLTAEALASLQAQVYMSPKKCLSVASA